jgi:hypothetical protein
VLTGAHPAGKASAPGCWKRGAIRSGLPALLAGRDSFLGCCGPRWPPSVGSDLDAVVAWDAVRCRPEPYTRVMGPLLRSSHPQCMLRLHTRSRVLVSTLAILLVSASSAPTVATTDAPVRVWSAEKYALSLLNCTRTGGWVTAGGACKGRGSGKYSAKRAPLPRSRGISRKVAWPWARALTAAQSCGHVLPGEPELAARFELKGYHHTMRSENVGCGWGGATPRQVILSTHRAMQAEKSWAGGHWKNIKYTGYKSVGIGVATRNGRTTVVYDFYGRRVY